MREHSYAGHSHGPHCAEDRASCEMAQVLTVCSVCKAVDSALPRDCPGREMNDNEQDAVLDGRLNFVDDRWVILQEIEKENDGSVDTDNAIRGMLSHELKGILTALAANMLTPGLNPRVETLRYARNMVRRINDRVVKEHSEDHPEPPIHPDTMPGSTDGGQSS